MKRKNKGLHFIIIGRVQGVFYRANTQRKANELGITGWARNLPDGNVEVTAFGDEQQLEIFTQWLWEGPTAARVEDIVITDAQVEEFANFSVR